MAERVQIGPKLRFDIFERDNFTCQYCGKTAELAELHIDHIWPAAEGGTNDPLNLITACSECNYGKGSRKLPDEMRHKLKKKIEPKQKQMIAAGIITETKSRPANVVLYPSVYEKMRKIAISRGISFNELANQLFQAFCNLYLKENENG